MSPLDIREPGPVAAILSAISSDREVYGQSVFRGALGRNPTLGFGVTDGTRELPSLGRLADLYRERLTSEAAAPLPVIAMYPVNRAVVDIPSRIRGGHKFDQVAAYDGAFQTQRNFRTFFEWFRERQEVETDRRLEESRFRDPQLQAVRSSIESFMPGYSDLRVKFNPLRMTLRKEREELRVDQLSDGEKILLSLIGDLARRMAIANPDSKSPLSGEGIVMIDEIDLHLHPTWQRGVVQRLPEVFPNVQFFLTSHSPVIASAVRPENLWVLRDGQIRHAEAFGQEVGLVLSEVFDTPPRLESIQRELDDLFASIRKRDLEAAQTQLQSLEGTIAPSDPELVRARTLLLGYMGA
jgi:predicted ATP-binding protein involved in virulence